MNPLWQTNIFLRRKDIDFLPITFLLLSVQISLYLRIIMLIVRSISSSLSSELVETELLIRRSTSKLEGQFRNLSKGRSVGSLSVLDDGLRVRSFLSSFCSFPTSSWVKSERSGDEDRFSRGSWVSWFAVSLKSLFPKVPIASNPLGQSLNSSLDSCLAWQSGEHKVNRNVDHLSARS